ncbi:MAG: glycosyltransferase [Oscillatoriales cyanobacterium RM2_1_1]|nr:glycosyltransferase [Oscillatoriales cyanobacterium RM2_1_1]
MNILFVIPYLASVYGGPVKVVQELSQSLAEAGLSVDVITSNANGLSKLDFPTSQWVDQSQYRVQYFNCWHQNDFIFSPSLLSWLLIHVRNYDIVHIHNIFAPMMLVAQGICQMRQVPYLVTPHGMLEPWALAYKSGKKQYYYQFLEQPALQKASKIHVLNSTEAKNIQALGFEHTVIIPNGIHRSEFEVLPNPDYFLEQFPEVREKTLILFLGRIDPKKGLDLLATAFGEIHRQFSQCHLIIAGPDSIGFLPTVQGYFEQANCLNSVTFTGMLNGTLKLSALAAADLYIAPSYSEGFSMSILEGMASQLPCIITQECNFPEAAEAKVAKVVKAEAKALEKALGECLTNLPEAKKMGRRAYQFVLENYTWEQAAQKLILVYQLVAKQTINLDAIVSNDL